MPLDDDDDRSIDRSIDRDRDSIRGQSSVPVHIHATDKDARRGKKTTPKPGKDNHHLCRHNEQTTRSGSKASHTRSKENLCEAEPQTTDIVWLCLCPAEHNAQSSGPPATNSETQTLGKSMQSNWVHSLLTPNATATNKKLTNRKPWR